MASQLTPVTLETPRLLLREFVESDWITTHIYGSDPKVSRYEPWGPNSESESENFVHGVIAAQQAIPRMTFELAIILRENGAHVGGCGLRITSATNREADMGYVIRRDYWNRGIATEAARAIVGFGFEQLNMHRIWATAAPDNVASQRVLEKIGMKREGLLRENVLMRGAWRDSVLFAILEHEWDGSATALPHSGHHGKR